MRLLRLRLLLNQSQLRLLFLVATCRYGFFRNLFAQLPRTTEQFLDDFVVRGYEITVHAHLGNLRLCIRVLNTHHLSSSRLHKCFGFFLVFDEVDSYYLLSVLHVLNR